MKRDMSKGSPGAKALMGRREWVLQTVFGASMLGLRSLATGIPVSILANPRRALALGPPVCAPTAQYIILSSSIAGDPINGNVPGTYEDANIVHPADPSMAPTAMTLNGTATKAALPWSQLPQNVLDRTCFFHHGTYSVVHGDERVSLELHGAVKGQDMLVSTLATQLAPCLNTVQPLPLALSNTVIYAQGRPQPQLPPASLASVLTAPTGPLANLQSMRDQHLDQLSAFFRSQGSAAQQAFVDRYATSREQVRAVSQTLLNNLAAIKDNSVASQILAAVTLIQMHVAPVISITIPFGGDNHKDTGLANETQQTVAGVAAIGSLMSQLADANLQDKVTFMAMNVFGRTMAVSHKGTDGRDHQGNHHCTVMIGAGLRGSIVGGVAPMNGDYGALPIVSSSGAGDPAGDIPFTETFASVGKTVGAAVGMGAEFLDQNITGGKVVQAALA